MSLSETIAAKTNTLPPEHQREILDFVEFLIHKVTHGITNLPGTENAEALMPTAELGTKSIFGLFADENIRITDEDIAEARREMWGNFPREFPR